MKAFSFCLLLTLGLVLLASSVFAAQKCGLVFHSEETSYETFRSNAPDFWAWSHEHLKKYFSQDLLTEGVVAGDPHAMNFGDLYLQGQKTKITLIDLDDSGHGAFLVDFARLLLSVKLSPSDLKSKKIWKAYLQGLHQESLDEVPGFVEKIMDRTRDEWNERQEKFVDKKTTDNDKLDKEELDLKPLKQLSKKDFARAQALIAKVSEIFPGAVVKDSAYKVKESGGSQGMLRIWVLIEQKGHQQIYEFKEMATPATQYFETQKDQEERLHEVTKVFWGVEDPAEYKVVSIEGGDFWLRPRYKYGLKFDVEKLDSDKKFDHFEEWNEYVAYLLGRLHGKQPSAKTLRQSLDKKDSDDVIEQIKAFTKDYREHMDQASGN